MQLWKEYLKNTSKIGDICTVENYGIYENSITKFGHAFFFIAKGESTINPRVLVIVGETEISTDFHGISEQIGIHSVLICNLSHENAKALRKHFSYTAPVSLRDRKITIGLGDRLGIATQAHVNLLKGYDVAPVIAQQSMRELDLTGRTYEDVLDDVTFAVFQEGYKKGFGADGDHLKTFEEVNLALDAGYTMITLDCSDHIDNDAALYNEEMLQEEYHRLSRALREYYEDLYFGKHVEGKGFAFIISQSDLQKTVLIYHDAIVFASEIFNHFFKENDNIVFEISIDETSTSTEPVAHYIIASELIRREVKIDNLAPRFCGDFQKGIDYIGDVGDFSDEFETHCRIAEHFGYKISVHSGSDKFAIFGIIGEKTEGIYHIKTSGTNWVEAVRTIATINPYLYRRLHRFALEHIEEAKKYYHISANAENIPDVDECADAELPALMDLPDARQYLHITYGLILNAGCGRKFRNEIFQTLNTHENRYRDAIEKHIGRHLNELNVPTISINE